jgi:hypothetical protein
MLNELGYEAIFVEDLENGDEIAFCRFRLREEDRVEFSTVEQLKRIPRYQRDILGRLLDEHPDYLIQWIARDDRGYTKPMQFGSGWACFRNKQVKAKDARSV